MSSSNSSRKGLVIFDTTLRDGEQAPGATMNVDEKIAVATLLDEMGVDVIEAGFAISSDGDFEAISRIAKLVKRSAVCSLARTKSIDIERAGNAVSGCKTSGRIHVFISTSPIHRESMLKMSKEQILEVTSDSIMLARKFTDNVEWSAQDATRTERDFLFKCIEVAIKAGATTVNIPDTVGYTIPQEYSILIADIFNNVPNIDKAVVSVHCQNDLGLATANSLAAVLAGAGQVECTINGIGERAGNASLEEVVMSLKTRSDFFQSDVSHINTKCISRLSKLVSQFTGFVVQNNKAIVGMNAFAHESGIHQDGVLKNRLNYEIMNPEDIGATTDNIVLGKHSGRHALKEKLSSFGFSDISGERFEEIFSSFKALCDRKKNVSDSDIYSLLDGDGPGKDSSIGLVNLSVKSGLGVDAEAELILLVNGNEKSTTAKGNGPIDSVFAAIDHLSSTNHELVRYQVNSIEGGTDAVGSVTVYLSSKEGKRVVGVGSNTDTVLASALAYINALNQIC